MAPRSTALSWLALLAYCITTHCYAQERVSAAVGCRVLDDIEHRGIPSARLSLVPVIGGERITAFTTELGACTFESVPRGNYVMTVEKAGYFPLTGQTAISFTAESPKTDLGDITLVAMRSIQGVVHWKNGDPADNVIAHALLIRAGRAQFRPGDARLVMTNDKGEFRLEGLRPGTYILYANTLGFRPNEAGRPSLPVFYPDLPAPNPLAGIDLRKTREASALTLTLRDTTGVTVQGTVTPSPRLSQGVPLLVGIMIPDNPAQPFAGVQTEVGKSFLLQNIPPGNYLLVMAEKETARSSVQPITVGAQPIVGMNIPFVDPTELDCDFEYSGDHSDSPAPSMASAGKQTRPEKNFTGTRVWAMAEQLQMFGLLSGRVGPDGHAHFDGAKPGYQYTLHIEPPPGAYVAHVLQAETELDDDPTLISADNGRIRVILATDGGTLNGKLTDTDGKTTSGFVVLAPADGKKQDRIKTATAGPGGMFAIATIAPGQYRLYTLPDNDNDSYLDPKYLAQLRSTELSIGPNEEKAVEVTLKRK